MRSSDNHLNTPQQTSDRPARNSSLDWVCGLMMIRIIIGHIYFYCGASWPLETIRIMDIILFANMPWFFFKAGMFFKNYPTNNVIRSSSKRLLIPWAVFGVLGLIQVTILVHEPSDIIHRIISACKTVLVDMAFPGNLALWFLLSLFFCRILASLLQKICGSLWAYAAIVAGFFLAFYFNIFPPKTSDDFFIFPNIFLGLIFFGFGYILRTKQYTPHVIIPALILFIILSLFEPYGIDVRANGAFDTTTTQYITFYPRALCIILVLNYIAYHFPTAYLRKSIISYIGRNSMSFYVLHSPIMLICEIILFRLPISAASRGLIILSVLVITLPLTDWFLRRYWPEALGLRRDRKRMTAPDELP